MANKTKRTRGRNKTTILANLMKGSTKMNLKDLKRNCVVRGLEFEKVINSTIPELQNWFHFNAHQPIDTDLLDQYDDYIEEELKRLGKTELIHPVLRLGYIGERDEEGEVIKRKRIKGIKKKKKKRERTEDGIFKGTKKALTFNLEKEGKSLEKTIKKVMKKFPDANEKSIKIWYKKSKRERAKK